MPVHQKIIYTIGHSTRSIEEFIAMLQFFKVEVLADIRNYPGSKAFPQFNQDSLGHSLAFKKIEYVHLKDLGGRRKPNINSVNTAWRVPAFRGYADYMQTSDFAEAVRKLELIAVNNLTAIMCSEAVWWRCHRSLVSDYLKATGWQVMHILDLGKNAEHPYTSPAKIINGKLSYLGDDLFTLG